MTTRRRRSRRTTLLLSAALLLTGVTRSHADPNTVLANTLWPMYGHDVKHTFRTSMVGPTTTNLLETTPLGDKITTQPTVSADGLILVAAGFSAWGVRADGRILYQAKLKGDEKLSSATFDTNGFFYIGDRGNALNKFDTDTGSLICRQVITSQDGDIKASPTISVKFPNRVYVGEAGVAGALFAIGTQSPGECQILWTLGPKDVPGGSLNSIALADTAPGTGDSKGLLIYAAGTTIYGIKDNDTSAQIVMSRKLTGTILSSSPVIDPATGRIFIGTSRKQFYGLNPDFSYVFPPVTLDSPIYSTAALSQDGSTAYIMSFQGKVHALNTSTGVERPGFPVQAPHNTFPKSNVAPVVDGNGNIYVAGTDRHVRGLHPNGSVFFDAMVGKRVTAPPLVLDHSLIVASWDGKVYRFCPPTTGSPTMTNVCGFTVDTTSP